MCWMMSWKETLTGHTGQELTSEQLNVRIREWGEAVCLQEIKDALAVEVGDDANVISKVEAMP